MNVAFPTLAGSGDRVKNSVVQLCRRGSTADLLQLNDFHPESPLQHPLYGLYLLSVLPAD